MPDSTFSTDRDDVIQQRDAMAPGDKSALRRTGLGHVLIVEDSFDQSHALKDAFVRDGYEAVCCQPNAVRALAYLDEANVVFAVVDLDLGEGPQFVVAEALAEKGIPFIFITGYGDWIIPRRWDDVMRWQKPIDVVQVVSACDALLAAKGRPLRQSDH